jgi:ribosomal protein L9
MSIETNETILKKIDKLEREIEKLKRDFLKKAENAEKKGKSKSSLFGSVGGGDITEEIINRSKKNLFRDPKEF